MGEDGNPSSLPSRRPEAVSIWPGSGFVLGTSKSRALADILRRFSLTKTGQFHLEINQRRDAETYGARAPEEFR